MYVRGSRRTTSKSPVTDRPLKSPSSSAPALREVVAAEAGDDGGWRLRANLPRQRRGVQIAGRFAAGDHYAHGRWALEGSAGLGEERGIERRVVIEFADDPFHRSELGVFQRHAHATCRPFTSR